MPITTITYSRLYNLGNFENEKYEAQVELTPGQTPEEAMAEARAFVEAQRQAGIDARKKAVAELHENLQRRPRQPDQEPPF